MQLFDNVKDILQDDLKSEITKGSKLSIAAACFSIYAYQALKAQMNHIDELRFIFTSPTFVREKAPKEKREFYIPQMSRERSIYGTEFEVKLRNELTQKAIARECADWIKKKVAFKSNISGDNMPSGFMNVQHESGDVTYMPIQEFTTVGIGGDRGNNSYNMVSKVEAPFSEQYIQLFESIWQSDDKLQDVTDIVLDSITAAYRENAPELIYFVTLYNIFTEFLEDISEDNLPNEATGFKQSKIWSMLYSFQKDAALAIIGKLEKFNGCILADSVGLGKTFTALAVVKYYENRNRNVLVLCPKKLAENWNTYKGNYINNSIAEDRLRYDVLFHTDLSREYGDSNGIDLARINWSNYDLVVIDESHNFRNGGELTGEEKKENRYLRLMNRVIKTGIKTKVLMLSATPVNNRFYDLKNQLELAYEGDSSRINEKLGLNRTIEEVFRSAQGAFNGWSKLPIEQRTTNELLTRLDFDFFEVLDSVTIARSRKHIEKYYGMKEIGKFPERLKPISLRPNLTDLDTAINYKEIYDMLMQLNLRIYTPSEFILASRREKYMDQSHHKKTNLTQSGRERGIQRLMSINLLKRLESSVHAFHLTIGRIQELIESTIQVIHAYGAGTSQMMDLTELSADEDFDFDDQNIDGFSVGKKIKIDLADMDYKSWLHELEQDAETLALLTNMISEITSSHDTKLQELRTLIDHKIAEPINAGNKKIIIFTAFSDTADYLYEHVSSYAKEKFGLYTAEITGSSDGHTNLPNLRTDLNTLLTCFSPVSKGKNILLPGNAAELDLLIATDCISEGQNLQDCDFLVNYDIHWNPVRIIQRFGRIDRIGSHNDRIQLVNFWPDISLDDYLGLESRVETRMKISVMTSTGDDDLLDEREKGDLEYRKQQLKKLQEEVVDIEDMSSGISIMDLGLNEFRMDLLDYMQQHPEIEQAPHGLHAVVKASDETPAGVIFVLRNIRNEINVHNQNRLHPFYLVYISEEGEVICDHLAPKELLDKMRLLCKGNSNADLSLCKKFNAATKDGRDMRTYSDLLSDAIHSIIDVNEEGQVDSFLAGRQMSFLSDMISGLDDFEFICFLVVKG